jgi:hypothetical protein
MAAPLLPYSISTGIQAGGPAEIAGYVRSVREQGFCVIERVMFVGLDRIVAYCTAALTSTSYQIR